MKRISIGTWAYTIGPYAANPERWSRATRNWTPIGLVVLNPPRAALQAAA